jgi:hypothetical protein
MIRFMIGNGRNQSGAGWRMALGLAFAAAFGFVLVAVGVGLALLLAPVVIVAGLIARARLRKMLREMEAANPFQRKPADADVIEGEFHVVEDEKTGRQ